jgi:hypothetical protein
MRRYGVLPVLALMVSTLLLAQDQAAAVNPDSLSEEQIKEIVRQVADKDLENDKKQRDYTYEEREEEHKLNGDGRVKSTESRTYEIMVLYEEPVRKLIAKDDKPLSERDAKEEDDKIQKIIDKRHNEDEGDRRKRLEKADKDREDAREFVREIAEAYNFHYAGTESVEGRDAYVIDAAPRPSFVPHRKEAKFLPKFRFRAWIDKAEMQWVKLDIDCIDTVSVGLFLVRIHKGSNLQIEQTRVNDEVWLPKHVALKIDARVALFKGLDIAEDVTYRDYQKFHANSKIVPLGEVPEKP